LNAAAQEFLTQIKAHAAAQDDGDVIRVQLHGQFNQLADQRIVFVRRHFGFPIMVSRTLSAISRSLLSSLESSSQHCTGEAQRRPFSSLASK